MWSFLKECFIFLFINYFSVSKFKLPHWLKQFHSRWDGKLWVLTERKLPVVQWWKKLIIILSRLSLPSFSVLLYKRESWPGTQHTPPTKWVFFLHPWGSTYRGNRHSHPPFLVFSLPPFLFSFLLSSFLLSIQQYFEPLMLCWVKWFHRNYSLTS